ncbi:MAG: hypothetical protein SVX43_14200, partial [Cyanobacteriota bacterium]|nr:hypothetical protein [Cyanobacteriota bacterium]
MTKFIGKPDRQSSPSTPVTSEETATRAGQPQGEPDTQPEGLPAPEPAENQDSQPKPDRVAARRLRSSAAFIAGKKGILRRFWFWFGVGATGGAIAVFAVAQRLENSLPDSAGALETFAREGTVTIKAADGSTL